jgi:hypothetical protein
MLPSFFKSFPNCKEFPFSVAGAVNAPNVNTTFLSSSADTGCCLLAFLSAVLAFAGSDPDPFLPEVAEGGAPLEPNWPKEISIPGPVSGMPFTPL